MLGEEIRELNEVRELEVVALSDTCADSLVIGDNSIMPSRSDSSELFVDVGLVCSEFSSSVWEGK
jgi:hypothetical protein